LVGAGREIVQGDFGFEVLTTLAGAGLARFWDCAGIERSAMRLASDQSGDILASWGGCRRVGFRERGAIGE